MSQIIMLLLIPVGAPVLIDPPLKISPPSSANLLFLALRRLRATPYWLNLALSLRPGGFTSDSARLFCTRSLIRYQLMCACLNRNNTTQNRLIFNQFFAPSFVHHGHVFESFNGILKIPDFEAMLVYIIPLTTISWLHFRPATQPSRRLLRAAHHQNPLEFSTSN